MKLIIIICVVWVALASALAVLWALFFNWISGAEQIYCVFEYPGTEGLGHGRCCDHCLTLAGGGDNRDPEHDNKDI